MEAFGIVPHTLSNVVNYILILLTLKIQLRDIQVMVDVQ